MTFATFSPAIITACLLPLSSIAEENDAKWKALDPALETVVSGGFWERKGADGVFRVLVIAQGWEHVGTRVLLQWVRRDDGKQELVVERAVPIKELEGLQWHASDVKFALAKDTWQIRIPVTHVFEEKKATFTVIPSVDHTYKITSSK